MYSILKHIIILTTASLMFSQGAVAKTYLVSVGVADYPGKQNDLVHPAQDAEKIEWIYKENQDVVSVLLTDRQATKSRIKDVMSTVYSQAGSKDMVVFFFSGHGAKGGFVVYDGILTFDDVRRAFASTPSKNKMIFSDSCFSGKMRGNKNDKKSANNIKNSNIMLFLSSRGDEESLEREYMPNGIFTSALQNGLRGHADYNNDRIITARELFDYVSDGVTTLSKGKQHPVMWGKFSDDMPVMKW